MRATELWLWLGNKTAYDFHTIKLLYDSLGDIEEIYTCTYDDYIEIGLRETTAKELDNKDTECINQTLEWIARFNIKTITPGDTNYPSTLQKNDFIFPVIFCLGNIDLLNSENTICINAFEAKDSIVSESLQNNNGKKYICSLDSDSSIKAIDQLINQNNSVIGVNTCGLDCIYPDNARNTMSKLAKNFILVSVYPNQYKTTEKTIEYSNIFSLCLSDTEVLLSTDRKQSENSFKFCNENDINIYIPSQNIPKIGNNNNKNIKIFEKYFDNNNDINYNKAHKRDDEGSMFSETHIKKSSPTDKMNNVEKIVYEYITDNNIKELDQIDIEGLAENKIKAALAMLNLKNYISIDDDYKNIRITSI